MIPVYLPTKTAILTRLGLMDQFLAWIYNHRRKTEDSFGRVDQSNPHNIALILQQGQRGALPHQRDYNQVFQKSNGMVTHPLNNYI
jgi:hypothetical protein